MIQASPSPRRLKRYIRSLEAFREAYVAYLNAGPEGPQDLRRQVIDAIPSAQRALDAVGADLIVADPPALGAHRTTYRGLVNTAFLHERPGFRGTPGSGPAVYEGLLDVVDGAVAEMREEIKEAKRRRWNPLHWADTLVRGLLAIPAYIVSRIVGTSVARIDKSAWGLPLRILAVLADGLAVYFGGHALRLW